MPYATLDDLIARFGELELIQLSDAATPGLIDDAVVARALADADAIVDGHLGGRYALPLAAVPPMLVNVACDLARARLYKDVLPEAVESRRAEAMRYLELLGKGAITLGASPEPASQRDVRLATPAPRRREGMGL